MQSEDNKVLVSRFLLEGLGGGNTGVVDEVFASDHVLRSPVLGTGEWTGTDPIKDAIEEFWSDGGEVSCTIRRQIAEGDRVATSSTLSEEDKGHLGIMISRVAEGKIRSSLVVASEVSEPEEEMVQRRKVFN
jgi:hypothetical protein